MKTYIITSLISFLLGLALSVFRFIPLNLVVLFLIISLLIVKFSIKDIKSSDKVQLGLKLLTPILNNFFEKNGQKNNLKIQSGRAIIEYDYQGSSRYHVFPYNRKDLARHSKYKVHLVDHDDTEIEITQIPGTAYKHSANDLNCKVIKVVNKLTNEEKVYTEDEIPHLP